MAEDTKPTETDTGPRTNAGPEHPPTEETRAPTEGPPLVGQAVERTTGLTAGQTLQDEGGERQMGRGVQQNRVTAVEGSIFSSGSFRVSTQTNITTTYNLRKTTL